MNKRIMVLVGPPGSGKSTFAKKYIDQGFCYVNQDSQGKEGHMKTFEQALKDGKDVIVDRMGFDKAQRVRYLSLAKKAGYETAITVFHESYETCLARCLKRENHETIKDETNARSALDFFFSHYQRVSSDEADTVQRLWPYGEKPKAIICDLDGTLCNTKHREHFVKPPSDWPKDQKFKKNWRDFFLGLSDDTPIEAVKDILVHYVISGYTTNIVYCSGRPDNYKERTEEWLKKHGCDFHSDLFMRLRNDQRPDNIVKEILLDFEILTRYTPIFMLDDRQQVVDMWRQRGYTCLQCAPGDF